MIFHKASNVLDIVSFPLCGCLVKLDTVSSKDSECGPYYQCSSREGICHKASNVLVIVSFPLCGCLVKLDTVSSKDSECGPCYQCSSRERI